MDFGAQLKEVFKAIALIPFTNRNLSTKAILSLLVLLIVFPVTLVV
jgi:hypothetical protein